MTGRETELGIRAKKAVTQRSFHRLVIHLNRFAPCFWWTQFCVYIYICVGALIVVHNSYRVRPAHKQGEYIITKPSLTYVRAQRSLWCARFAKPSIKQPIYLTQVAKERLGFRPQYKMGRYYYYCGCARYDDMVITSHHIHIYTCIYSVDLRVCLGSARICSTDPLLNDN